MKKEKALNVTGNIYTVIGAILCFSSIALLAYPQLPYVLNKLNFNSPEKEVATLNTPITTEQVTAPVDPVVTPEIKLPDKEISLTEINTLIISKIGIKAEIITGENSTEALKKGPWIVFDYASPEQNYLKETTKSIIIASHRFGYSSWSTELRNRISFFNLPQTIIGDHIIIIWNQREYVYEIFESDESKYIKDVDADLILYTCKYYDSPLRIFRFANLISINGNPV